PSLEGGRGADGVGVGHARDTDPRRGREGRAPPRGGCGTIRRDQPFRVREARVLLRSIHDDTDDRARANRSGGVSRASGARVRPAPYGGSALLPSAPAVPPRPLPRRHVPALWVRVGARGRVRPMRSSPRGSHPPPTPMLALRNPGGTPAY